MSRLEQLLRKNLEARRDLQLDLSQMNSQLESSQGTYSQLIEEKTILQKDSDPKPLKEIMLENLEIMTSKFEERARISYEMTQQDKGMDLFGYHIILNDLMLEIAEEKCIEKNQDIPIPFQKMIELSKERNRIRNELYDSMLETLYLGPIIYPVSRTEINIYLPIKSTTDPFNFPLLNVLMERVGRKVIDNNGNLDYDHSDGFISLVYIGGRNKINNMVNSLYPSISNLNPSEYFTSANVVYSVLDLRKNVQIKTAQDFFDKVGGSRHLRRISRTYDQIERAFSDRNNN
ncbi:hypothetical protein HN385_02420 [archaeon]|jgi:hypothetical protein|nr:hypothetical protein [archaeon]MBT3450772.1 hypothetical protein [archaeon]MBT6868815.1 hypothetical protein [archaeon]MBT7192964.1 hypothetical protein [archaeon]MBT7380930.1 hypothetical protein [archaeon]